MEKGYSLNINKKNIGLSVFLSIITFGIYGIFWQYALIKNVRELEKDDSSCVGEMLLYHLVPYYYIFWWFTRGKTVTERFKTLDLSCKGHEVAYLVLAIFSLTIVSMAIMQNDFNSIPLEEKEETKSLITCKNLSVGYDGAPIVSGINFSVENGDYLAIVGENGAGKTTVMKTVLGLLKPISGDIERGGDLKKNEIGYLPQQTAVQKDFPASVYEVVLSGCLSKTGARPFYNKNEKAQANAMLNELGISHLKKKPYRELSGGQQQRVLLARALLSTRRILLLDEPVAGLDPLVTAEMYTIIETLNKMGTAIIMITHDLASALKYANKILYIGSETFFGDKNEFKKSVIGQKFMLTGEKNDG